MRPEVRDLRCRVDSGIGPSRTADIDVADDLRGRSKEVPLDRFRRVTLRLPS